MSQSADPLPAKTASKPKSAWNDPKVRGIFYQILVVVLVALGVWYLVSNTLQNLSVRNIATGFDFLAP